MAEPPPEVYEVTLLFGTVELGRPTGLWIKDADGWSRQEMTDTIWRDGDGREYRRAPTVQVARIRFPEDQPPARRSRPWWAFWRLTQ